MIQGYTSTDLTAAVNFMSSRAGLTTVGYTILDKSLNIITVRTTVGVQEVKLSGLGTGTYTTKLNFGNTFEGYILWDTGQDPNGVGTSKLRTTTEELSILDNSVVLNAVQALYEENVMKTPDQASPTSIAVVRKHSVDPDWTTPYSQGTVYVVSTPGELRFGGPKP